MNKIILSIYIFSYIIIVSFSFVTFSLFQPFDYIDNDQSYILCNKDQIKYETGPNLIFAINDRLDPFNDKKAKKLCEYRIIRDYGDTYQTPKVQNYTLEASKIQESSWYNALFVFFLTLMLGSAASETIFRLIFPKEEFFVWRYIQQFLLYLIK